VPLPLPGPPAAPAFIPAAPQQVITSGGAGGFVVGVAQAQASGVSVAFTSPTLAANPAWTAIEGVQSFTIDRGRSYELDKMQTGTATVQIIDTNGTFDPTNGGSPYAGNLNPMKQVSISLFNPVTSTTHMIYRGFVADWNGDWYQKSGGPQFVTLECVDGMDLLAATEMYPTFTFTPSGGVTTLPGPSYGDLPLPGTPGAVEGDIWFARDNQAADRINQVLNQVGWPSTLREIFSGNVELRRTLYPYRTQALTVIQDAADAEFPGVANFLISKDGKATFHGRLARFNPNDAQYHIAQWKAGDLAAAGAEANRAPIFGLGWNRGKSTIINSAISTPQGMNRNNIHQQIVYDQSSMATFGTRSVSFENLITRAGYLTGTIGKQETKKFATYYVTNQAQPRTRVSKIVFRSLPPGSLYADRVWRILCNIDISDIINLQTSHTGGGGFNEDFYVEGLHYRAGPMNATHHDVTLEVDVSPRAFYNTNPF
jgi:hypothetical protein